MANGYDVLTLFPYFYETIIFQNETNYCFKTILYVWLFDISRPI